MDPEDLMEDEDETEAEVLETCPVCGEQDLVAVCEVIVEYSVENTPGGDEQSWDRMDVDDDTSEPQYFRCDSCKTEFHQFTVEGGYLRSLTVPEPEEPKPITDPEFREWLTARVARFAEEQGDDVEDALDDEFYDCGEMWTQIESGGELDEIGVTCAWDHEAQMMYFAGKDAEGNRWLIGSAYEIGIEEETIWLNPLITLVWGPTLGQTVAQAVARTKRRAAELEALLTV
ncbi:MAG: hypothetical protein WC072_02835 [Methanoregulaceae archaeon]|jgi:hypothetical protein